MASNQVTEAEHKITFDVNFKRDSSGTWNLDIRRPQSSLSNLMNFLLAEGMESVNFKGKILDETPKESTIPEEKLQFHLRGGLHSAICENGRTAFAFGNDILKTWAVTKRTLQLNELFEVELKDEKVKCEASQSQMYDSYGRSIPTPSFCIGVTLSNPDSFEEKVNKRPNGWFWNGYKLYVNESASASLGNSTLKVGDRVGVVQDSAGKLHFFVNGVDQGEYKERLPFPLYGCIQFDGKLRTATIKDPGSTYGYLLKINTK